MRAIRILVYTLLPPGNVPVEQQSHPGVTVVHGDFFACKQADCEKRTRFCGLYSADHRHGGAVVHHRLLGFLLEPDGRRGAR